MRFLYLAVRPVMKDRDPNPNEVLFDFVFSLPRDEARLLQQMNKSGVRKDALVAILQRLQSEIQNG